MQRALAVAILLTCVAPAGAQESFSDHYDRAAAHSAADQYEAALRELDAAYKIRQLPKLLYEMGRMHQNLGHAKEAFDFYMRYLAADSGSEQEVRADAERRVRALRALTQPEAVPAAAMPMPPVPPGYYAQLQPVPLRYEMRSNKGLIAGGATLLATAYFAATVSAAVFVGVESSSSGSSFGSSTRLNYTAGGGVLFIPVLGPFISAGVVPQTLWATTWTMVDGAAQVAGLAMIIAGVRDKKKTPIYASDKLRFAPFSTGSGGGFTVSGRF
jgi:hypothetical protein